MAATAPSAVINPPAEDVEYIFDYSRSTSKMRFSYQGQSWLVDRIAGQWEFKEADRKGGKWKVRCQLVVREGTAYVFAPGSPKGYTTSGDACNFAPAHDHSQCQVVTDHAFPQGRETHWRLCYSREIAQKNEADPPWRLRDERTGDLWLVHGYQGIGNINYFDRGSHVFVDGPVTVDAQGIAHF